MQLRRRVIKLLLIAAICYVVYGFPAEDGDAIDLSTFGLKFGQPDMKTGEMLKNWSSTDETNPEEMGSYLEGDILFPMNNSTNSRNGMVAQSYRWSNAVIPYEITGSFDSRSLNLIQNAMGVYHKQTCIKFVQRRANDRDYITIQNSQSGCWSSIGRVGGGQTVNLQSPACTTKVGTVLHELMHAAGFMHEQNREERDQYIDVVYPNIMRGYESNFVKAAKGSTSGFGVGYDYGSVMHYSAQAFSSNGQPTIRTKVNNCLLFDGIFVEWLGFFSEPGEHWTARRILPKGYTKAQ